jgi:hypothetical protein
MQVPEFGAGPSGSSALSNSAARRIFARERSLSHFLTYNGFEWKSGRFMANRLFIN